jgi:hypothetical protein
VTLRQVTRRVPARAGGQPIPPLCGQDRNTIMCDVANSGQRYGLLIRCPVPAPGPDSTTRAPTRDNATAGHPSFM